MARVFRQAPIAKCLKLRTLIGMLTLVDLAALLEKFPAAHRARVAEFSLGSHFFANNSAPSLMGVVNLSPDSWYRESVALNAEAAIRRGRILHEQGARLIDLGAESSLAHAARVDAATQESALIPVVHALATAGLLVSVETYHPTVTRRCLQAGAKVLNLTGSEQTEEIFHLVAEHEAGVIICFVQGANVRQVGDLTLGADPIPLLYEYFARQVETATRCGVTRLWIDPGLGFYYRNLQDSATRIRHQMNVFLHTFRLRTLGWPTCHALPHAFECFGEEVRSAEAYFAVLALLGRTDLLRTHEIPKVRAVLRTQSLFSPTTE